MYVSRICLISIHGLFSLENLTGSSNEKYDTTNLITKKLIIEIQWNETYDWKTNLRIKNLRIEIHWNYHVFIWISLGVAMNHKFSKHNN